MPARDKYREDPKKYILKMQEWYSLNKERVAYRNRLRTYGITAEEYDRMCESQQGRCAICKATTIDNKNFRLSVDHNHDTGAIRGLLCNNCNRAVGLLGDNALVLRRAADYLEGNL